MTAPEAALAGDRSLDRRRAIWLVAPFFAYATYAAVRQGSRLESAIALAITLALASWGRRSRELLAGLFPLGLVFILYDGMRPFQRTGLDASRVLLCDLRSFDATLFGRNGATIHDYFRAHHSPALDLFCALPYATFIAFCVAGGIYLYGKDRRAMVRFTWGFFLLNAAGFATYHAAPAAPPWYYHARGCVVDLATTASEGPALARVDALLGVPYFHAMYGKASSVFGALPSLHCAYPVLLLLEAWRVMGKTLRAVGIAYAVAMIFSAIYLDHHWVTDACLGVLYAVAASFAVGALTRGLRAPPRATPTAAVGSP